MATIKSCTDLKQSKVLSKILSDESADMVYIASANDDIGDILYTAEYKSEIIMNEGDTDYINCWSLAALLSVLPSVIKRNGKRMFLTLEKACAYNLYYKSPDRLDELLETKEEPIDACVAMIIKLYELNWL